ncbi:hypothetical protein MHYP_G00153580 [Metynnis hypsauchen]
MPGHCASTGSVVELLVLVRIHLMSVSAVALCTGCRGIKTWIVWFLSPPLWTILTCPVYSSTSGRPVTSGGTIATPAPVTHFHSHRPNLSFPMATAEPAPAWWKLTFLRKKKSEPKVLYEIPAEYINAEATPGTAGPPDDSQFNARLERIVDKTATKGRHVKVSHSGRFKEKKRIRATLSENPELFPNPDPCNGNESTNK